MSTEPARNGQVTEPTTMERVRDHLEFTTSALVRMTDANINRLLIRVKEFSEGRTVEELTEWIDEASWKAKTKAERGEVVDPVAWLIRVLESTEPDVIWRGGLSSPKEQAHSAGQPPVGQDHFDYLKTPPISHPPLALVFCYGRVLGHDEAWRLVEAEWVKQGKPLPQDFDERPLQRYLHVEPNTPDA